MDQVVEQSTLASDNVSCVPPPQPVHRSVTITHYPTATMFELLQVKPGGLTHL